VSGKKGKLGISVGGLVGFFVVFSTGRKIVAGKNTQTVGTPTGVDGGGSHTTEKNRREGGGRAAGGGGAGQQPCPQGKVEKTIRTKRRTQAWMEGAIRA